MSVAAHNLPIEIKKLIKRKIRHSRGELVRQWSISTQSIYTKLRADILECIQSRRLRRVFTTVPLFAYKTLVANANDLTTEWPSTVWEIIASVLVKASDAQSGREELNAIIDEFAWAIDTPPFTLDFINAEHLREIVGREASRYGLDPIHLDASDNQQWSSIESLATVKLANNARSAREGVSIAIDEYILAASHLPLCPKGKTERNKKGRSTDGPDVGSPEWRKQTALAAANTRHDQPGGSRDKQQRIRNIWATGKYSSRDRCAEEECKVLGMSFKAARNALLNTPAPKKPPRC